MRLVLATRVAACFAFKAAFVEYKAVSPCGNGSCGPEQKAASVSAYDAYTAEAARQGAEIVVFPEYGITGFFRYPKHSWVSSGYTETIPNEVGAVACDVPERFPDAPAVVSLSCTAKKYGVVVVMNLMEYTGGMMYNTNVALDSDGAYLAKYRKHNLWGGEGGNVDSGPLEHVSFKTKFGETFGMFICADLMYQHPALDLVRSGIKNFVMSLAWSNEMAQMQAIAYAQGWTIANRVNLVFANHHGAHESGSGILVSGVPVAQYYHPSSKSGPLMVGDVSSGMLTRASAAVPKPLARFDLSALAALSSWNYGSLGSEVCSGAVCCTATVLSGSAGGYHLAVLDGTDTDAGMKWPAQVCAVVPCSKPGPACLKFQQPMGSLRGVSVSMTGSTSVSVVPEVLGADGSDGAVLLTPGAGLQFVGAPGLPTASVNASSPVTLISAILYGRGPDSSTTVVM